MNEKNQRRRVGILLVLSGVFLSLGICNSLHDELGVLCQRIEMKTNVFRNELMHVNVA